MCVKVAGGGGFIAEYANILQSILVLVFGGNISYNIRFEVRLGGIWGAI